MSSDFQDCSPRSWRWPPVPPRVRGRPSGPSAMPVAGSKPANGAVSGAAAVRGPSGTGPGSLPPARGTAEATVEVSDAMLEGHASLPNGFGLDFTGADGKTIVSGVAPNSLTSSDWRDEFAGTPWHKHVPARIEAL